MDRLIRKIKEIPVDVSECVSEEDLYHEGLHGIKPRKYQIYGINWLLHCQRNGCGGAILGDEMGLGKTIQTIAYLLHTNSSKKKHQPHLIVAPLTLLDNWNSEFTRFCPSIKVLLYHGNQDSRALLRADLEQMRIGKQFDVCLTSYDIALIDQTFFQKYQWDAIVVDEAQRLKNPQSNLHLVLLELRKRFSLLLTGTPVQNKLEEMYALLSFIAPSIFDIEECKTFCSYFKHSLHSDDSTERNKLHGILKPFLLRRTKAEVLVDLPKKSEVIIYTGLSKLQRDLYKGILLRDVDALISGNTNGSKTRLMNILMQLRKCCNHPYIFTGVEPEPFEIGDHIINASGKLFAIDQLLSHLKQTSHKVLLFCQMTMMLDIIQDYLTYKGYTYERLDGSVRGEERYLAVSNFNSKDDTFIFLLSTKAGGVGLNLTSADTIIFVDNDFNPQNDLQAAARAHRIGQNRPVKIIRLLTENTVDEIVYKRAEEKLKLTHAIIEGGQFSNINKDQTSNTELERILKFGLDDLLKNEEGSLKKLDLISIVGDSIDGKWQDQEQQIDESVLKIDEKKSSDEIDDMYTFDGFSYRNAQKDEEAIDQLKAFAVEEDEEMPNRSRGPSAEPALQLSFRRRKRRILTEEEKEERKRKREENEFNRQLRIDELNARRAQQREDQLKKLWEDNDYTSLQLDDVVDDDDELDQDVFDNAENNEDDDNVPEQLNYVVGDVTNPKSVGDKDRIILHCADNSGVWGTRGIFSALLKRSSRPGDRYELAGRMKDLSLGSVHLVDIQNSNLNSTVNDFVALIIVQKRDRNNAVSHIMLSHLLNALEKIYVAAKKRNASVHLPRIGHNTPNFNWYAIERTLRKSLTSKGIPTYIYYYPRKGVKTSVPLSPVKINDNSNLLSDLFTGMVFLLSNIAEEENKKLKRYIVAFDGEITKYSSTEVTHVVSVDEKKSVLDDCKNALRVSPDWIWNAIRYKKIEQFDF